MSMDQPKIEGGREKSFWWNGWPGITVQLVTKSTKRMHIGQNRCHILGLEQVDRLKEVGGWHPQLLASFEILVDVLHHDEWGRCIAWSFDETGADRLQKITQRHAALQGRVQVWIHGLVGQHGGQPIAQLFFRPGIELATHFLLHVRVETASRAL